MALSALEKRYLIYATALEQANKGGHYLKGTDGDLPGFNDGLNVKRDLKIKEDKTEKGLSVHAAANGYGVCRGRYVSVYGEVFKPGDSGLEAYIESLSACNLPPSEWEDFQYTWLFPRRDKNTAVYLGEDCRYKRHFDCESFIAWVICHALKQPASRWKKGVTSYNNGLNGKLEIFSPVPDQSEFLNGDILIKLKPKEEHIGFVKERGINVVHASQPQTGVIVSHYNPSTWTAMARIKDEYLFK